jgi:hypothetical protein
MTIIGGNKMFKNKAERENILDGIVNEPDYTEYPRLEIRCWRRILPDGYRIIIEGRPYTLPKIPGFRDEEETRWLYQYYLIPLQPDKYLFDYKCSKSHIIDHMTHLKVDKDHEKLYQSEEGLEEIIIKETAAD